VNELAAKAAGLAADGYHVFPVTPGAKTPLHAGWQSEATTDVEQVAAMWRGRQPEPNIGIRTGGELFVVDLDVKNGVHGVANWETLMSDHGGQILTRTVRTPSGGLHHYFIKPLELVIPNSAGKLGPGIDVRGDGGFVLGPGSVIGGESYEVLHPGPTLPAPEWLPAPLVASSNGDAKFELADTPIIEGGRSDYLVKYAGRQRGIGHTVDEVRALVVLENERACRPPLSSSEIDDTIMKSVIRWEQGETPGVMRHGGKSAPRRLTRRAFEGEPERVSWFWYGWLPRGKLSLQDGDPDKGKSTILLDLAARITTGRAMPDGNPGLEGGGFVLVLMGEDGHQDTTYPRLIAAGADLTRIEALDPAEVLIPRDVPLLEEAIRDTQAVTVFFDPLNTYLGDEHVNTHNDKHVRQALNPLIAMAERTGCAIIGNRHLNKGGGGPAIYRGMGSIGIGGLARSVWCVADEPGNGGGYIFASVKHNLTRRPESLRYSIGEVRLPTGSVSRIEWKGGSSLTADDVLGEDPAEAGALVSAIRALEELLEPLGADGMAAHDVEGWAKSEGTAKRTLARAKAALGVLSLKQGFDAWVWVLPPKGARVPK
jgi:Bifunctional DNA primase/polymerase, N-terminal/AAA domain/Primase C terminal 1 (PriCT-1)